MTTPTVAGQSSPISQTSGPIKRITYEDQINRAKAKAEAEKKNIEQKNDKIADIQPNKKDPKKVGKMKSRKIKGHKNLWG